MVIFRHPAPLVLWWAWVAFALVNIGYLIADGLTIHSVRAIAVLLAVSGVMYACTLHARVEATPDGVTIYNPLRRHQAAWGSVTDVRLGQSVEFDCTRPALRKRGVPGGPAPQASKPTTIYSWALYSSSRSRARSQMHSNMFGRGQRGLSSRAPAEAAALAKQHPSQLMADELGRRAANAQAAANAGAGDALAGGLPQSGPSQSGPSQSGPSQSGPSQSGPSQSGPSLGGAQQDGALRSRVSWQPVAAIVIPVVFVLIAFLVS
jgi:hypothetical protein